MSSSAEAVTTKQVGMHDARETKRLGAYLEGLWARREYITYVSRSELRARHMDSVLGNLWHLLNPLLQIAVYYVIFGLGIRTTRGVDNFIAYLVVGVIVYNFTQRSTMQAAKSLSRNRGLVRLISFPRAMLPITTSVTEMFAAISSFGVVLAVVLATGVPITARWLVIIPLFGLQVLFNLGAGFIAARAADRVADVQNVLPFIFRLGFYASGIIFNVDAYIERDGARLLFYANPMYCFVELYRWAFLADPAGRILVLSCSLWTVVLLVGGFAWFRSGEDRYGRD